MRHSYVLLFLPLLLMAFFMQPRPALADSNLCFNVPGITSCIAGRFQEYWEQNGGLPVFGYPLTNATMEQTAEGSFLTQYFERNRFELHQDKARPYDVLLGRLGDDRLKQEDRDWHDFGPTKATTGCLFFPETNHNVCDLQNSAGFKSYWEGHGLQDPTLNGYQRSLALFGLPLSDFTVETNAAGDTVVTQWFERARFEFHIDKPVQYRVLLGLLGNETRNPQAPPPSPLPPPEPAPNRPCDGIGGPDGGIALPPCVHMGESLVIGLLSFAPNQAVSFSLTNSRGQAVGGSQSTTTNQNGQASITINTGSYGGTALASGDYVFMAQSSGHSAHIPFRVIP
ncbi:MAG: hypothetical protein H0X37_18370 [Herpetosiphonaceae bacterium]|nr:hypothetical protein [Herpetosiphonaceae bacterium]